MRKSLYLLAAALATLAAGETKLGKPLEVKQSIAIDKLMADPEAWVGKSVQVKGRATEVCQMMGCWTVLADPAGTKTVRIKVKDGEIVFPKDITGKMVVAEGRFAKQVLTREQAVEQARQEAEESKRKFDPASVKSGVTLYQIQGSGAVILD